ncbi:hypothetical protein [Luteithermobacter gelatinilyticus]|uniref:hypothetical protein n=1 Tax=Luteithermobacter gelatinilyticus TaxID=2582913 RepID=UPI0011060492|nr:hypothetical protein [Luteithermobacter gelatinilyticus]|tara:strand:- start:8245 stop:8901 length:657 start_codon:yes stop_codon:yes gene_type:complete
MQIALEQIKQINLDPERALIISDADEVLLHFTELLDNFLRKRGMYLRLESYKLAGNIRYLDSDVAFPVAELERLLDDFFDYSVDRQHLVDGARENLDRLSENCEVVILTNIPHAFAERRRDLMKKHGLDYPLVSSSGLKGPVAREIAAPTRKPVIFIDDIARHITSVAEHVPHSLRLHFIAHEGLRRIADPAPDSHHRCDHWDEIRHHVEQHIQEQSA